MHSAPRVIQHATACSFPIQIFKSILAGCTFSVPLTRCLLRDDVEDIIYHNQGGTINTYIDDIPITLSDRSKLRFKRNIINIAKMYSVKCKGLLLLLSPKSVICTSDFKMSVEIAKILRRKGIHYQPQRDVRDLGITFTAGLKHKTCNKIIRHRFIKTTKRSNKIGRIAKITKRSRVLFSGSQYSANTWGHQVVHFTQAQIDSIEKRAALATGIHEAGRCRSLALIISYGPRGHPIARILKELFSEWFRAVRAVAKLGAIAWQNLISAWPLARANLADKYSAGVQHDRVSEIKTTHGMMSNVIIWLYKLGWNPAALQKWVSPDGTEYVLSNLNFPTHLIVFAVVDSLNDINLRKAARHRNGKGMEKGVVFSSLFSIKEF